MRTKRTERGFDCVAHKREAQARIYEQIKQLAPDEEAAYFEEGARTGPLGEWWLALKPVPEGRDAGRAA